jgi:ATP-dependent Lon protease
VHLCMACFFSPIHALTLARTHVFDNKYIVSTGAIDSLVRWYCREAGVRNLEKHIEKVLFTWAFESVF